MCLISNMETPSRAMQYWPVALSLAAFDWQICQHSLVILAKSAAERDTCILLAVCYSTLMGMSGTLLWQLCLGSSQIFCV